MCNYFKIKECAYLKGALSVYLLAHKRMCIFERALSVHCLPTKECAYLKGH